MPTAAGHIRLRTGIPRPPTTPCPELPTIGDSAFPTTFRPVLRGDRVGCDKRCVFPEEE